MRDDTRRYPAYSKPYEGVSYHFNRGCESLCARQAFNRHDVGKVGNNVMQRQAGPWYHNHRGESGGWGGALLASASIFQTVALDARPT